MAPDALPSPGTIPSGALLAPLLALAVVGCTVRAGPEEIVIDHMADYWGVAQALADSHCAKYGKIARHAQMGPVRTPFPGIRRKTSIFECVDEPPRTDAGPGQTRERP